MNNSDEVAPLSPRAPLARALSLWDVPKADADWLAAALDESGQLPIHNENEFAWYVNCEWQRSPRRAAIALRAFDYLVQPNPPRVFPSAPQQFEPPSPAQQRIFVAACERDDVNIGHEFLEHFQSNKYFRLRYQPNSLFESGALRPADYIQVDGLLKFGRPDIFAPNVATKEEADRANGDPARVRLWASLDPVSLIEYLKVQFQDANDERLASLTRGLINELHPGHGRRSYTDLPNDTLIRDWIVGLVEERLGPDPRKASVDLRRTWLEMWIGLWFWSPTNELETPARINTACAIADIELGHLRKVAREATTSLATEEMIQRVPTLRTCADCLFEFKPLWDAMRPFLLLLRSLSVPGVASDLRYWVTEPRDKQPTLPPKVEYSNFEKPGTSSEAHSEQPPQPWNAIVLNLIDHFNGHAYREQNDDPELQELRTKFARYCLDRLKSSKGRDHTGPVEASVAWRHGYLQAVGALHINPEGEGHHTLHHVMHGDPAQSIRDAAKKLYPFVRRSPNVPKGISPRRLVLAAVWELRMAHLKDLGAKVSHAEALETQQAEIRRTMEPAFRTQKERDENKKEQSSEL